MITKSKGMTLIEVLVALFILVTGVLGAIALQTNAKQGSFDAMQRSLASALAQDIIERMRNNNADGLILEGYEGVYGAASLTKPSPSCQTQATSCTPAELRTYDLYEWTEMIRGAEAVESNKNVGGLINAVGCIVHNNQQVTVTIVWDGKTKTSDAGGSCGGSTVNSSRRQIQLTTYLF
ncbi:type IV pilus modification protein PilV [Thalassotalea euphylliae]|uniref:Type IV pilus modification protein PilV n=1 Tax=Thalassotalea euphylliae TaxID=1655234 RepID=A0A3E0TNJ6_9GAMM|nr:type IV pilus modification protein PilV [Thalassotalea euphylliae]REL26003.1 type IV pilus modification protein PilV [Thalassotalea euphylliae]